MQHDLKTCTKCGEAKSLADFYSRQAVCKVCYRSKVRANRLANIDRFRAYDRERGSRPDRIAARKSYQQTEAFKDSHAKASKKYRLTHAVKKKATTAVGNALRNGRLQKLPCWVCGAANSEAHHPDYSAPLAVVWLCDHHHKETHKLANRLKRKAA